MAKGPEWGGRRPVPGDPERPTGSTLGAITLRPLLPGRGSEMKAQISVMLNVKDVERSVSFYRSLGFTSRWMWKGGDGRLVYAGVGIGDAVIALGRIILGGGPGEYRNYDKWVKSNLGGGVIINVELRNVEGIYAKARKAKATIESRLREWPYGTAFTINDPNGYVVKFLRSKGEFA
jgi:uncharacterized glyoxalase superfamily protein PhnB